MQTPGIIAIHATTSTNALHYIYNTSGDDTTRKLALLQAVGWQPLYRGRVKPAGSLAIDALEPLTPAAKGDDAVVEVFDAVSRDRLKAARTAVGYLANGGDAAAIFAAARRLIFHKGRDSHDYKYGAAIWEECLLSSDPRWHAPLVASAMFNLPGSQTPDSPLMNRAREAVKSVAG